MVLILAGIQNNEHPYVNSDPKKWSVHQQGQIVLPDVVTKSNEAHISRQLHVNSKRRQQLFSYYFPLSIESWWLQL
jgi:hypothetical protein